MHNALVAAGTAPAHCQRASANAVRRRAALLAALGCIALSVGVLVYLTDRDARAAWLIPVTSAVIKHGVFGTLGHWLPSFVHPFAFSLFTAAALRPGAASRRVACTVWCAVNLVFEAGQHAVLKPLWAEALRSGADDGLIARALLNYFAQGTFDVRDVLAVALGTLAAAALLRHVDHPPETRHAPP